MKVLSVRTSDVRIPGSCFYISKLKSFDCGNESVTFNSCNIGTSALPDMYALALGR